MPRLLDILTKKKARNFQAHMTQTKNPQNASFTTEMKDLFDDIHMPYT